MCVVLSLEATMQWQPRGKPWTRQVQLSVMLWPGWIFGIVIAIFFDQAQLVLCPHLRFIGGWCVSCFYTTSKNAGAVLSLTCGILVTFCFNPSSLFECAIGEAVKWPRRSSPCEYSESQSSCHSPCIQPTDGGFIWKAFALNRPTMAFQDEIKLFQIHLLASYFSTPI